jgi:hypothetical protein
LRSLVTECELFAVGTMLRCIAILVSGRPHRDGILMLIFVWVHTGDAPQRGVWLAAQRLLQDAEKPRNALGDMAGSRLVQFQSAWEMRWKV